jgi:hypothetical protein
MNPVDTKVALVIPSCDAYADVWPPLLQGLQRFWPDNAFAKYLVTNQLRPAVASLRVIAVGDDVSWSDNLLFALDRVAEPYVLLNIDDLILSAAVDHAAVMAVVSRLVESGGNYLRLNPTPPGNAGPGEVGLVPPGDIYRSSTVFSLWRKEVLQSVLRPGESAWHFEINGSARTDVFDNWFASKRFLLSYVNLVIKGKVDPRALAALARSGISYESSRSILSGPALAQRWLQEKRSRALELLPRRLGRSIRSIFRPA